MSGSTYRLVIADDHPLFRGALREAVAGLFDASAIAEAGSFDDLSKLLDRNSDVDLVLLDLAMPGARGFSGLMYMRAQFPSVPVVIVSGSDDQTVRVWDPATGRQLSTLSGHSDAVNVVLFDADGWQLYSAGLNRTVKRWSGATGK